MAQFDVHRAAGSAQPPYFVILQSDVLRGAETIVVAPLYPEGLPLVPAVPRLFPTVWVAENRMVLVITQVAAVRRRFLGAKIGSLADNRDDIIAALDLLFTGV